MAEYKYYWDAGVCRIAYHHADMPANHDFIRDEIERQALAATSVARAWRIADAYHSGTQTSEYFDRDLSFGEELERQSIKTILSYNCQKYLSD